MVSYADIIDSSPRADGEGVKASYRDKVMETADWEEGVDESEDEEWMEAFGDEISKEESGRISDEDSEKDEPGVKVVEGKIGQYDCQAFFLSEKEATIQRPWRNGVIVKLLGRWLIYDH